MLLKESIFVYNTLLPIIFTLPCGLVPSFFKVARYIRYSVCEQAWLTVKSGFREKILPKCGLKRFIRVSSLCFFNFLH